MRFVLHVPQSRQHFVKFFKTRKIEWKAIRIHDDGQTLITQSLVFEVATQTDQRIQGHTVDLQKGNKGRGKQNSCDRPDSRNNRTKHKATNKENSTSFMKPKKHSNIHTFKFQNIQTMLLRLQCAIGTQSCRVNNSSVVNVFGEPSVCRVIR